MFLSANTIREMILERGLIVFKRFCERFGFIEGSSFDLTVNKVYKIDTKYPPFIGIKKRITPNMIEIPPYSLFDEICHLYSEDEFSVEDMKQMGEGWYLPQGYYVLSTEEQTNLPPYILGILKPRRTYLVSGCPVFCTDVAPGYQGILAMGIGIFNPAGLILEKGSKAVAYRFGIFDTEDTDAYKGIWGGDKVQTNGVERGS